MKISIIIPVYRVEKYIKECIDSVLSQTYRDIEVILVDDGSPDLCPQICEQYVNKDSRVQVVHKLNGGLSDARNYGLKVATGDYVIFLDSDDYYLKNDFLQEIVKATKCGTVDAIFFKRTIFYEGANQKIKILQPYDEQWNQMSCDEIFYILSVNDMLDASACMKATKRSILQSNELFFTKGIYCEDIEWFCRYSMHINSLAVVNKPDYCYRKREGSITASLKEKNVKDLFFAIEEHAIKIRDSQLGNEKKVALLNYLSYQYYIILGLASYLMSGKAKKDFYETCKNYSWLVDYSRSNKTRKSSKIFKILGLKVSSYVLGFYIRYRK